MQKNVQLNATQTKAVQCIHEPSIVLAGAGSGKTRVLIHKVEYIVCNSDVTPHGIVMITFTNKAAGEMKERIARLGNIHGVDMRLGFVGTFHSLCAFLLRLYGAHVGIDTKFTIYTGDEQEALIKQIIPTLQSSAKLTPGYILHKISEAKNQLITPHTYLDIFGYFRAAQVAQAYHLYQQKLRENNAFDFDDLIMQTVFLLREVQDVRMRLHKQYRHVMIDEFQDTNGAQYELMKLLAGQNTTVTVVGDFSQAIYSWRGADIRNLERFTEDFPHAQTFHLEQNYRSTQDILDYAYAIINQNKTHPILRLFTESRNTSPVVEKELENEQLEGEYVSRTITQLRVQSGIEPAVFYPCVAVLYRTNAQSRAIEEALINDGIPYVLVGGTRFYDRKEIRDILSYLRLCICPTDTVAIERIQKLGKRKWELFRQFYDEYAHKIYDIATEHIIDILLAKVKYLTQFDPDDAEDYARLENIKELQTVATRHPDITIFFEQVALVENEYFSGEKNRGASAGVRLMSLHASKGLEFDYVFLVGVEEGLIPHVRSIDDVYALEEERRLLYVGVTRARHELFITYVKKRGIFGRRQFAARSRFLQQTPSREKEETAMADTWDW